MQESVIAVHDIINFLKIAVERNAKIAINSCYVFNGEQVYARCESLIAGIETSQDMGTFNVPADALDVALSRMKNITGLKFNGDELILTVRAGRMWSEIRCIGDEPVGVPEMPEEWSPSPSGLCHAINLAFPFINQDEKIYNWTAGVWLVKDRVFAASNFRAIDIQLPGLVVERAALSRATCEFLVAQGDPDELYAEKNSIFFRWSDGRWVKCRLLDVEMSIENVNRLFAETETPVKIDASIREAFSDASALAITNMLRLTSAGWDAKGEAIMSRVECDMGVEDDHLSYWDARILEPIIANAESWQPKKTEASPFRGRGFKGVVMPRSKWDD